MDSIIFLFFKNYGLMLNLLPLSRYSVSKEVVRTVGPDGFTVFNIFNCKIEMTQQQQSL